MSKQQFQQLNEAYQVLRDADRRRLYDLRLRTNMLHHAKGNYPGDVSRHYSAQKTSRPSSGAMPAKPGRFEKAVDNFLFFTLFMGGLSSIFIGLHRLFIEPVEGARPHLGLLFGLLFTSMLVYGWDRKKRSDG